MQRIAQRTFERVSTQFAVHLHVPNGWLEGTAPLDHLNNGSYSLQVSEAGASATDLGTDTKVDLIDVEDNANNIALNIAALHALGSKLSNITLTADEPIQITEAQQTAYQTTLDKILGGADIDIV